MNEQFYPYRDPITNETYIIAAGTVNNDQKFVGFEEEIYGENHVKVKLVPVRSEIVKFRERHSQFFDEVLEEDDWQG